MFIHSSCGATIRLLLCRMFFKTTEKWQKRKKIKSALQEFFTADDLSRLGINPDDRPQKLTPDQYLLLAKSLK